MANAPQPTSLTIASAESVAFQLMDRISNMERAGLGTADENKREYWLRLYAECLAVVKSGQHTSTPARS